MLAQTPGLRAETHAATNAAPSHAHHATVKSHAHATHATRAHHAMDAIQKHAKTVLILPRQTTTPRQAQ